MKKLLLFFAAAAVAVSAMAQDMYMIGSNVNGKSWSLKAADAKFTPKGNGVYEWTGQVLGTGFKINDGSWAGSFNLGSNGSQLEQGVQYNLNNSGASGNIALAGVTEVQNPHVVLNISDPNMCYMVLTGNFGGEIKWYLAGINNIFLASDDAGAIELKPTTGDVYTSDKFAVTEPSGEFKIASTGWSTEFGTNTPAEVTITDTNLTAVLEEVFGEAGNIPYTLAAGDYTCTFDKANLTVTFVKDNNSVESITVDNNQATEYFNLQGVRVNNPAAGNLYIVRQGNNVTKKMIR